MAKPSQLKPASKLKWRQLINIQVIKPLSKIFAFPKEGCNGHNDSENPLEKQLPKIILVMQI